MLYFLFDLKMIFCLDNPKDNCWYLNPRPLSLSVTPSTRGAGRISHYEDLGSDRKLYSRARGQRAMTWKCPVEEQHADVLLFQRVSSTGTVSCLYPLNHPSLLSWANTLIFLLVAEKINSAFLKSSEEHFCMLLFFSRWGRSPCFICFIVFLACCVIAAIIWNMKLDRVAVQSFIVISAAGLPLMNWPIG